MDQAPELITEVVGGLGRITLNRPRALNALSLESKMPRLLNQSTLQV